MIVAMAIAVKLYILEEGSDSCVSVFMNSGTITVYNNCMHADFDMSRVKVIDIGMHSKANCLSKRS